MFNFLKKSVSKGLTNKMSPEQAFEGFKAIVDAHKENHKVTEVERTKREEIGAYRDIEIEKIQSQKEILKSYFEDSFSERKENFNKLFDALDKGIELNNPELIMHTIRAITDIAKDTPLNKMHEVASQLQSGELKRLSF
jgi:hypothetical protein